MTNKSIDNFLTELSSSAPVPGGGGVAALAGSLSAALCSMVAELTTGKKKYAAYQSDIERIISEIVVLRDDIKLLIQKDAEAFEPLSKAYSIPKDEPGRDEILENALKVACAAPFDILKKVCEIVPYLEELEVKGSKIALSDVGVAASMCRAAIESSALNVYINTKLMKNREYAKNIEAEISSLVEKNIPLCEKIYSAVKAALIQ